MRAYVVQNGRIIARRRVQGSGHASVNAMLRVLVRTLRGNGCNAVYMCSVHGIPYVLVS